jgi:hypothetical protein
LAEEFAQGRQTERFLRAQRRAKDPAVAGMTRFLRLAKVFMRLAIHTTFVIFALACGVRGPSPPVPPETFAKVYADLTAEQAVNPDKLDSLRTVILARHGVSPELFDEAVAYYRDHPEELADLLDTVVDLLKEKLDAMAKTDSLSTKVKIDQ